MKTNKKILIIFSSLFLTACLSAGISFGTSFLLGWSFWPLFWLFFSSQILISFCYDRFYESKKLLDAVKEYTNKPYKKYIIPINCGHCGTKNELEIDLTDTEFRCPNCKKYNGIHINFMAAAITEPVSDNMI